MARVLLIDDDEIERLGRAVVLEQLGHEVSSTRWAAVDELGPIVDDSEIVLLAIRPDPSRWDRFAALAQVPGLRARLQNRTRFAAMVWGEAAANPMLGIRLAAAGIGEVLEDEQVRTRDGLNDVVAGRTRGHLPRPSSRDLALCQVGPNADPDEVLAWVLERAADEPAYLRAFDIGCNQNQCGLSRRQTFAVRAKVGELGQMHLDTRVACGGPLRRQTSPRWTDVVRFVNLCRGADDATVETGSDPLPAVIGR